MKIFAGRSGALIVLAFAMLLSGAATRADDVPASWATDEYLTYLMFTDIVPEAIKWNRYRARSLCFATDLDEPPALEDPSEQVLSALRKAFGETYPGVVFLPKSQCSKSIEGDNLYLFSARSDPNLPGTPSNCEGEVEATYTKGGWGGNGYIYRVRRGSDATSLERTSCQIAGIIYAP